MMQDDRIEERFHAAFPEPAPALRGRVLAAARPEARPGITWTDRAWYSRRWRLAAVALLFAVIGLDRISVVQGPGGAGPRQADVQSAQAADEAARQAGLPPDQADALARHVLLAASRPGPRSELSVDDFIQERR